MLAPYGEARELRLDSTTVATGLLHDTVEDTVATPEQIDRVHVEFGMPMGPFAMIDLAA